MASKERDKFDKISLLNSTSMKASKDCLKKTDTERG